MDPNGADSEESASDRTSGARAEQGESCRSDNVGGGGGTRTRVHGGPGGVSTSLAGAFHLAHQLRVGRIWLASSGLLPSRPDRAAQPVPSPLATPHLRPRACRRRRGYCLGSQCEITLGMWFV